jgi:hypothetical protein
MHALLLTAVLLTSHAENVMILKAIDKICSDSWCEGDYSFRFDSVQLDTPSNSTRVVFSMSLDHTTEVNANASILTQKFEVLCHVPGYSTFAGIMQDNDRLNLAFYTSLTACIQDLEGRLSRVNRVN